MIGTACARRLLAFGARIGDGQRAEEQLEGAVAIHRILTERRVAYLADEVGMGKTYVALGALALFRHYDPGFRVLVIAPRENIQRKWMKELRNFVAHNVRFADMRVKALDGRPCRPLVACGSLLDLVRQVSLDPNRDFFVRLTSFSLPVTGQGTVDPEAARRYRAELREHLPWLPGEAFDLRSKQAFKDNVARAICCALPRFDLVIIDEGHNLKHGLGERVAARNRVLALALGRADVEVDQEVFPGYGPRAERVLFLSATPVEESYRHLWNQLDVVGRAKPFGALREPDAPEEEKRAKAAEFLIRRVTTIRVGGEERTKNQYRREWRRGGAHAHDEPILIEDPRQRLVVALVQKKVSELLGHSRFNSSFQIGMLASFESFLETTRLKRDDPSESNFDDAEQTDELLEREGIDVADVNRLARSYRKRFDAEMPHPKMDAVVDSLSGVWERGEKALVFVRRVGSVRELERKLDDRYDAWLRARLLAGLPSALHSRLEALFERYRREKREAQARDEPLQRAGAQPEGEGGVDPGGRDTFFAWFFRGEGPRGVTSGATIQQRFIQRGAVLATFFADNYVADVLGCRPGEVDARLAEALGFHREDLRARLREGSRRFLSRAKKHARADRFEAVQAAAIELLKGHRGTHQRRAGVVWQQRFEPTVRKACADEAPEVGNWLELPTFFTELRERSDLRHRLWPESKDQDPVRAFREEEIRGQLLASAARLGHGLIDLYVMTIRRLGSLDPGVQESTDDPAAQAEAARIHEYLDLLEAQMHTPRAERAWGAFDELADIAENFDLLLDVNDPDAWSRPLSETARGFGQLLGAQQPVGGMSGQVNQTLVRQFRMPGYPLVLVTTDLLQEGEDLHTFCSSVYHYGIAWTPSSMEQRIGRVDRVCSQTERRLGAIDARVPAPAELLQVYFPHLEDTVEVLQVRRVLERMNEFLRLMHEGLTPPRGDEKKIDACREILRSGRSVPQITERLRSAFPVMPQHLTHDSQPLAVGPADAGKLRARFERLASTPLPGLDIVWEPRAGSEPGLLLGTARLRDRVQPFSLLLRSAGVRPVVRCVSPVGRVGPEDDPAPIVSSAARVAMRIGAIETDREMTYDLTVEDDVLLAEDERADAPRVAMLVQRVVQQADRLEQEHLPGRDEVLATFRADLTEENHRDR